MQKVDPRSKLRFPALYLQQLTIPHVKHGLAFVPEARLTFANRTQFRHFRTYSKNFVSDYFPGADRWVQLATENPVEPFEGGVCHLHPTQVARILPAAAGRERTNLLCL